MSDEAGSGIGKALGHFAVNLFYGYGYNYYREENHLRADDQRIRRMVSDMLQRARKALSEAEGRYRREKFPAPSREHPFPPAADQANARRLEALAATVSALDGQIAHLPVPENDFMTQRYRQEAQTLRRLAEKDVELIERAQALCTLVEGAPYAKVLDDADPIEAAIAGVQAKLLERQSLLA
jgi:hypothetical protein